MLKTQHSATQTEGFRPVGSHRPEPLFRQRPTSEDPYLRFDDTDGFACFVANSAVGQMAIWGRQAGANEVIGRLAGRACTDSQGPYVLVESVTLNCHAQAASAFVRADESAQESARRQFDRQCRTLDCVGWWHTHPGALQLFYSSVDRQNQATWSDPDAIGIVLNPHLKGEGLKVFRGPDSVELQPTTPDAISKVRQPAKPSSKTAPRLPRISPMPPTRRVVKRPEPAKRNSRDSTTAAAVAICLAIVALLVAVLTHVLLWTRTLAAVEPSIYAPTIPSVMVIELQPYAARAVLPGQSDDQGDNTKPTPSDPEDKNVPDTSMAALVPPAPLGREPQNPFESGILNGLLTEMLGPDIWALPSDALATQEKSVDVPTPGTSVPAQPSSTP